MGWRADLRRTRRRARARRRRERSRWPASSSASPRARPHPRARSCCGAARGCLFSRRRAVRRLDRAHRPARRVDAGMLDSLRKVILPPDEATVVCPATARPPRIARERATNPFAGASDEPYSLSGSRSCFRPQRFVELPPSLRPAALRRSSCTGSPRSRPARWSRWSVAAQGRDRQRGLRAAPAARDEDDARPSALGLHFDLTVPFARYVLENAGRAGVPVPALPDPEGLAGRAAAGRALSRVHPGRHRRDRARQLAFHHDVEIARGDGGGAERPGVPAPVRLQVNNRKLIEGFYRGVGASDIGRASCA